MTLYLFGVRKSSEQSGGRIYGQMAESVEDQSENRKRNFQIAVARQLYSGKRKYISHTQYISMKNKNSVLQKMLVSQEYLV
jgi:hypothetical protein